VNTFRRGETGSIVDITLASAGLAHRISQWRVREKESLADHQWIDFQLGRTAAAARTAQCAGAVGWAVQRVRKPEFKAKLQAGLRLVDLHDRADNIALEVQRAIGAACDASMPKKDGRAGRKEKAHWWTDELSRLKTACSSGRRRLHRCREEATKRVLLEEYRCVRRKLKQGIRDGKMRAWKELCETADQDPWGLPYRIIAGKLAKRQPLPDLVRPDGRLTDGPKERTACIMQVLFPEDDLNDTEEQAYERQSSARAIVTELEETPLFTVEELTMAVRRLKPGKAPGIDGITNEIVRLVICNDKQGILLAMFNACLEQGRFPKCWKVARVILLRKGDKPVEQASSYRPISLLPALGKLLERLVIRRIEVFLQHTNGLSDNQYGFRRGRSTLDAIGRLVATADEGRRTGGFCLAISLDIRNAFNEAWWPLIVENAKAKRIPGELLRIVRSFLHDRSVQLLDGQHLETRMSNRGCPQGSVFGPALWNLMFDELLRVSMPDAVEVVAFADDTLVMVTAKETREVAILANEALRRIGKWLKSAKLTVSAAKSQAVLFTRRHQGCYERPRIFLANDEIEIKGTMKYLGVLLDRGLTWREHFDYVKDKCLRVSNALVRMMGNTWGPRNQIRKLLYRATVEAVALYACPIWAKSLNTRKTMEMLVSIQRPAMVKICRAYRSISTEAAQVLAGTMPLDLIAKNREVMYRLSREPEVYVDGVGHLRATPIEDGKRVWVAQPSGTVYNRKRLCKELDARAVGRWQERYDASTKGRRTWKLLPDIKRVLDAEHLRTGYRLTQFLCGHGCFKAYLHRRKRALDDRCRGCGYVPDEVEHMVSCPENVEDRAEAERKIEEVSDGRWKCLEGDITEVLLHKECYGIVNDFVTRVLLRREEAERQEEKERREAANRERRLRR
jgi:hypothetical protein